jgi:hypothetical protein
MTVYFEFREALFLWIPYKSLFVLLFGGIFNRFLGEPLPSVGSGYAGFQYCACAQHQPITWAAPTIPLAQGLMGSAKNRKYEK